MADLITAWSRVLYCCSTPLQWQRCNSSTIGVAIVWLTCTTVMLALLLLLLQECCIEKIIAGVDGSISGWILGWISRMWVGIMLIAKGIAGRGSWRTTGQLHWIHSYGLCWFCGRLGRCSLTTAVMCQWVDSAHGALNKPVLWWGMCTCNCVIVCRC